MSNQEGWNYSWCGYCLRILDDTTFEVEEGLQDCAKVNVLELGYLGYQHCGLFHF